MSFMSFYLKFLINVCVAIVQTFTIMHLILFISIIISPITQYFLCDQIRIIEKNVYNWTNIPCNTSPYAKRTLLDSRYVFCSLVNVMIFFQLYYRCRLSHCPYSSTIFNEVLINDLLSFIPNHWVSSHSHET